MSSSSYYARPMWDMERDGMDRVRQAERVAESRIKQAERAAAWRIKQAERAAAPPPKKPGILAQTGKYLSEMEKKQTVASKGKSSFEILAGTSSFTGKLGFLLVVIFAYVIFVKLGILFLGWAMGGYASDVPMFSGMRSAKEMVVYAQDPSESGAKPIFRSVNQADGIEFAWSTWMYIDGLEYGKGKYRCVFYKGNDSIGADGLNYPNNAPGLYIAPNSNELRVIMNTFDDIDEHVDIPNIPMNKWVHVTIMCENKKLNVYLNGLVARSVSLTGVPKQNYGNVYVCANGGYDGYISKLTYYNRALTGAEIQDIVQKGPSVNMADGSNVSNKDAGYLSMRWYQ